jgi:hypothetical protein
MIKKKNHFGVMISSSKMIILNYVFPTVTYVQHQEEVFVVKGSPKGKRTEDGNNVLAY